MVGAGCFAHILTTTYATRHKVCTILFRPLVRTNFYQEVSGRTAEGWELSKSVKAIKGFWLKVASHHIVGCLAIQF